MSAKRLGVSLLLLAAWSCAHAGPVYKIVGPDGKITFSDKPPAEATNGSYQVVGNQGFAARPAPVEQPSVATTTAEEPRIASASAPKEALRAATPQTLQGAPSAAVEGAVIGVLGIEDIVKRTQALCVDTLPTSLGTYDAAVTAWQGRNGPVVALARQRLASEFDAPTREAIVAGVLAKNDGVFGPVRSASAAARISWCDQSFATMSDGKMDVHSNPKLTAPLEQR